jgi:hypothetical protein
MDAIRAKVPNHKAKFFCGLSSQQIKATSFTTRIPDFMISHRPGKTKTFIPFFLAEVGFTESYKDLVKAMKYWLKDRHDDIKIAFLVKFDETPVFKGQRCFDSLDKQVIAKPVYYAQRPLDFDMENVDGKVRAHGATFVGRTTAFLEVWELKGKSKTVGIRGKRIVSRVLQFSIFLASTFLLATFLSCILALLRLAGPSQST